MDEEDGRPGALAAQTGHSDALSDVPKQSLRFTPPFFFESLNRSPRSVSSGPGSVCISHHKSTMEKTHENVPGK
jgi:hypothetical protein